MKFYAFAAITLLTASVSMALFAKDKVHTLITDWDEEGTYYTKMAEYETLIVKLPNYGSIVSATITDNPLNYCEVKSIKYKGKIVEVALYLGETNFDDGFNGCVAEIKRNGESDEDGIGIVHVSYGFDIDG
jgi:hypothetical protein